MFPSIGTLSKTPSAKSEANIASTFLSTESICSYRIVLLSALETLFEANIGDENRKYANTTNSTETSQAGTPTLMRMKLTKKASRTVNQLFENKLFMFINYE